MGGLIRGLQNLEAPFGKVLILLVRSRHCGELNRGLQNLEAFFEKGFNFVSAKPPLRRAELRFAKPRNFPERETVLFFSLVRKEPKVPQRFANLWTPGTIQSSIEEDFSKAFRRHVSKPVLPAKRRRKGFESVRKGGCTANARLMFLRKRKGVLQAHSRLSRIKFAAAR